MVRSDGPQAGDFVHSFGDVTSNSNHLDQARLQLTRPTPGAAVMKLNPDVKDIFAFHYEDSCSRLRTAPAHQGRGRGGERLNVPHYPPRASR